MIKTLFKTKSNLIKSKFLFYYQFRDKKIIEKELKDKFEVNQNEKLQLIDDIEEHTEKIRKLKDGQRFFES